MSVRGRLLSSLAPEADETLSRNSVPIFLSFSPPLQTLRCGHGAQLMCLLERVTYSLQLLLLLMHKNGSVRFNQVSLSIFPALKNLKKKSHGNKVKCLFGRISSYPLRFLKKIEENKFSRCNHDPFSLIFSPLPGKNHMRVVDFN